MYFSCGKGQLMSEEEMEEKVANVIYHLYGSLSEGFRTIPGDGKHSRVCKEKPI